MGHFTGGSEDLSCNPNLATGLNDDGFPCSFPPHSDAPLSTTGERRMVWGIRFFQCQVEKSVGKKKLHIVGPSFIYPPTACLPGSVCVWSLGLDPSLCLLQLTYLPLLHRPRHPAASRPYSSEPRHSHPRATSTVRNQPAISPPLSPWRSQIQEQPSPTLGPSLSLESSSLRKESSSCPFTTPTMPSRGVQFYIQLSSMDF